MNDYINTLLTFFLKYAQNLESNNIIKSIDYKKINIDFFSKSKKGDVSSNFYLIIRKRIIDENIDVKENLKKNICKLKFVKNIDISETGFINIFFNKNHFFNSLKNIINKKQNLYDNNFGKGEKINIEFVSANPTGPLHVAHIRGAVFGDVLSTILNKCGYSVLKEYYVNNAGSQIDILGNSLFKRYSQIYNINLKLEKNEYPGKYLIEIAKKISEKDGKKWLTENRENRELYFKKFAVNYLLNNIKEDLKLLNIKFDKFTFESDIINNSVINKLFEILNKKNLIYEGVLEKPIGEEAKDWEPRKQLLFKATKIFDDKDRAFKKNNGEWTYFANDAAYHYNKYLRKFDKLINIWGADHIGYIKRMKSILKAITNLDNYLEVIVCQIVKLIKNNEIIKMSKREDNFIPLKDVFDSVGKDPIRYFMISTKNETLIDFDMNKVLEKNKDNPVFYCQYAYVRTLSVLKKAENLNININNIENESIVEEFISIDEWEIIIKILSYPYILQQSAIYREPHRLTNYLEEMSSLFHSFWNKGKDNESLRFIDEKNTNKTIAKLIWLKAFNITFKKTFDMIGIESPKSM